MAEHQRVLESVIDTVRLIDLYQSVVFAVENEVPLLKILTNNENCHFSSHWGIEMTSVLSTRLPIGVNHNLEVLLALRNRINSSLIVQNILAVFMHQLLQLANQFWLNTVSYTHLDVYKRQT